MSRPVWIILDDDADIIMIMDGMCQIWQVDMITLRDGFEAMSWIERFRSGVYRGRFPELGLLDIRMPGPQGHEVARELRKLPELERMAVVLMTAYRMSTDELEEVMGISDADDFIEKPLPRLFELNRRLLKAIEARKTKIASRRLTPQPPQPEPQPQDTQSTPKPPSPAAEPAPTQPAPKPSSPPETEPQVARPEAKPAPSQPPVLEPPSPAPEPKPQAARPEAEPTASQPEPKPTQPALETPSPAPEPKSQTVQPAPTPPSPAPESKPQPETKPAKTESQPESGSEPKPRSPSPPGE